LKALVTTNASERIAVKSTLFDMMMMMLEETDTGNSESAMSSIRLKKR